jgi:hypothetical protein
MTEEDWDSPNWQEKLPAWVREGRPMTEVEWLDARHLYDRLRSVGWDKTRLRVDVPPITQT